MAVCYVCHKETSKMCHACQTVFYCSKVCQKVDWKQGGHKKSCRGSELSPQQVKTVAKLPKPGNGLELTTCEEIDVAGFEAMLRMKFDGLAKTNMEELRAIKAERKHLRSLICRHSWPSEEQVSNWIKCGNVDRIPDHVMFIGTFGSANDQLRLYNHELFTELYQSLSMADHLVKVDGRIRRVAWLLKKHGELINPPDGIYFIPIAMFSGIENLPIIGPVRRKCGFRSLLFHYLLLKHFAIDRFLRRSFRKAMEREEYSNSVQIDEHHPSQMMNDRMTMTTMIDHAWNSIGEWIQMPKI